MGTSIIYSISSNWLVSDVFHFRSLNDIFHNNQKEEREKEKKAEEAMDYNPEIYLMVTQLNWEDDIIWDGEQAKQKILQSQKQKALSAGWIPSNTSRTASIFSQQGLLIKYKQFSNACRWMSSVCTSMYCLEKLMLIRYSSAIQYQKYYDCLHLQFFAPV